MSSSEVRERSGEAEGAVMVGRIIGAERVLGCRYEMRPTQWQIWDYRPRHYARRSSLSLSAEPAWSVQDRCIHYSYSLFSPARSDDCFDLINITAVHFQFRDQVALKLLNTGNSIQMPCFVVLRSNTLSFAHQMEITTWSVPSNLGKGTSG